MTNLTKAQVDYLFSMAIIKFKYDPFSMDEWDIKMFQVMYRNAKKRLEDDVFLDKLIGFFGND